MSDIKVIIQEENFNAIIKEEKIVVKLNGNITSPVFSVNQKRGNVILNKNDIGLGNVNNTSDIDKPVSDATEIAIDLLKTIIGTRAFIFNQTPANGTKAFATDQEEEFIYINGWQQSDTIFSVRNSAFDAGSIQDASRTGYNKDSVNGKHLSDVTIGSNRFNKEGGVRTLISKTLNKRLAQFFLDGNWQTVLTGVNITTDASEGTPDIEFTDFEPYKLSLITGNSDTLGIDGLPAIQRMKTSAGSRQLPMILDGGTF